MVKKNLMIDKFHAKALSLNSLILGQYVNYADPILNPNRGYPAINLPRLVKFCWRGKELIVS